MSVWQAFEMAQRSEDPVSKPRPSEIYPGHPMPCRLEAARERSPIAQAKSGLLTEVEGYGGVAHRDRDEVGAADGVRVWSGSNPDSGEA